MRPRTYLLLAIAWIAGAAYATTIATAGNPVALSSPDRNCDCQAVSAKIDAELAELHARMDTIEQRLTQTRQTILNTLDEVREQNELVRSTQRATVSTSVPVREVAAPVASGPHLQAYVAPASYAAYQNAAGQLPSTSIGGQVITASPAYTYTDSQGRTVVDYPVSISAAPPVNVPVVNAGWQQAAMYQPRRSYGYSYAQPAYYGGYSGGYSGGCVSCR